MTAGELRSLLATVPDETPVVVTAVELSTSGKTHVAADLVQGIFVDEDDEPVVILSARSDVRAIQALAREAKGSHLTVIKGGAR